MMKVTVRYFAQAAEKAGCREESLVLAGNDQDELRERLVQLHPELADVLACCRLAVNGEYVQRTERLPEGAEIAVIPPVSGG